MENPWQVDSVEAFTYLKCPECIFDAKEEKMFQNHAVENHPLSKVLFGKSGNVDGVNIIVQNYDPFENENGKVDYSSKFQYFPSKQLAAPIMVEESTDISGDKSKHLYVNMDNQSFHIL